MKYLLILTLTLLVGGCADFKDPCHHGMDSYTIGNITMSCKVNPVEPTGETTSVNDCIFCEINELEEPYIGEYYFDQYALCDSDGICITKHGWYKFKKNDVLDKHNNEIKLKNDYWTEKFFYYSDIPDQYQSKREEIEKQVFKQSIIDSGVAFMDMEGNYKPNLGRVDPPEETENMVTYTGTMNYDWNETWSYCQDFILTNPHEYTFEIKNGQLEARCKE